MRKTSLFVFLGIILLLISTSSIQAIKIDKSSNDLQYNFILNIEKTAIGYKLESELTYIKGEEDYLIIGDTGCEIYNADDELVWTSYDDEGATSGLGKGSKITTTNIWTQTDSDGNYVKPGTYKIIGVAGLYIDNECTEIYTEPQFIDIEKIKTKDLFLSFLFRFFQPIFSF